MCSPNPTRSWTLAALLCILAVVSSRAVAIASADPPKADGIDADGRAFIAYLTSCIDAGLASGITEETHIRHRREWLAKAILESRTALDAAKANVPCGEVEGLWAEWTKPDWTYLPSRREREKLASSAAVERCADPLVNYVWLRQIENTPPFPDAPRGMRIVEAFLRTPAAAQVHPAIRMDMARIIRGLNLWGGEKERDALASAVAVDALTELLARHGGRMPDDRKPHSDAWWHQRFVAERAILAASLIASVGGVEARTKAMERACEAKGLDPWIRNALLADAHGERAWAARGGAYADETPVERFAAADDIVPTVERFAEAAFAEDPTRPEPAISALSVARLGALKVTPGEWFGRGLKALPDSEPLWRYLRGTLRPRWSSDQRPLSCAFGVALLQDPDRSSIATFAYDIDRTLSADGIDLAELLKSTDSALMVTALEKAAVRAVKRGSTDQAATLRAKLVGLGWTIHDWALIRTQSHAPEGLDEGVLRGHGISGRWVSRQLQGRGIGKAQSDLRTAACDPELAERWAEARDAWTKVIESFANAGISKSDRDLISVRRDAAAAAADVAAGKAVKLSGAVADALFIPENGTQAATSAGIALTYDPRDPLRRPMQLSLAPLSVGKHFELSCTFDLTGWTAGESVDIGVLVRAGNTAPRGYSTFLWNPATGEGRIGRVGAIVKGIVRCKGQPLGSSKRAAFRIVVHDRDAEIFLDGSSMWKGQLPKGDPYDRTGEWIGLIGYAGATSALRWSDIEIKPLGANR